MSDAVVKSADRALVVLEFVAERSAATFSEVADGLALPRSSAHGLLNTLASSGWLVFDPATKLYSLGLRAWQVGQRYEGHRDIVAAAQPRMDALAAQLGETVQLARLDGLENVYIAISDSPNPMRLASSVGMRLPSYATGIGKALLSMLDPADAGHRLRAIERRAYTAHTVTGADELLAVLGAARAQRFAVDDEEFTEGCRCVAVPLTRMDAAGLYTAMSVTMPTFRTTEEWPRDVLGPLRETAAAIQDSLGIAAP